MHLHRLLLLCVASSSKDTVGIGISSYIVSKLSESCRTPLFMTTKLARAVFLQRISTSAGGGGGGGRGGTDDNDPHVCEPNFIAMQNKIIDQKLPVYKFITL